ncbi:MAG: hypothetical protein LQ352_005478 [Teloschistes flavicans]|nr:MAG: hypothetical protein LQ352_005478 [Teloschistes flavicans]
MRVAIPPKITGTRRAHYTNTAGLVKYILNEPPLWTLHDPNTKCRKSSLDPRELPLRENFDRFPATSPCVTLAAFERQFECMLGEGESQLVFRIPLGDPGVDESEHAGKELSELAVDGMD